MEPSRLSVSIALTENLQTEDPERFTLYASLIRVGLSIMFGAIACFLILMIIFTPTLISIPFGQTGTTLIGLITSGVSYKIYRISKVSNLTVLTAGRGQIGPDSLWERSTKTTARRAGSSLLALVIAPSAIFLGAESSSIILDSISEYTGGLLADLGSIVQLSLLGSVIAFDIGIVTISLGCILVFWSLITPLRSALLRGYMFLRFRSTRQLSTALERISGVSQYSDPEEICARCFCSSFELVVDHGGKCEYKLVCSRCKESLAGVDKYYKYKNGQEAVQSVHMEETRMSIQD